VASTSVWRWTGAAFALIANAQLSLNQRIAVDGGGDLHVGYSASDGRSIIHRRVTPAGVVGAEETVVTAATGTTLGLATLSAGAAGVLHAVYLEGSLTRHAVQTSPGGPWTITPTPAGLRLVSGAVDAGGTFWGFFYPTASTTRYAYGLRAPDGQWTYPTLSGTTFTSRVLPGEGTFLPSPDGRVYFRTDLFPAAYHLLDAVANTVTRVAAPYITTEGVVDSAGTLHMFGVDKPNQVDTVRHWWWRP
jgi:hypothetical protein